MHDRLDSHALDQQTIDKAIDDHKRERLPAMDRYWSYFRNESEPVLSAGIASTRRRLAQEAGLPSRLTGRDPLLDDRAQSRREIVIENDIAWRVQTMIDFLFGKPVRIMSTARDVALREKIDALLDAVWEQSGGVALLQDMALLGHVFGHVDLILRLDESDLTLLGAIAQGEADANDLVEIARAIRVDVVEPRRGIPIIDESDYRRLRAYVIHFEPQNASRADRTRRWLFAGRDARGERARGFTEIITGTGRRVEIDGEVIEESPARLLDGELPIVHMQNISQPFRFEGLGEVEPLVPLQDELNTRLSDRASRVTMQTFKMYLARGIDGFDATAVGPGQIWSTDNLDASIESFGGDADSPSETAHIGEIREAMDKISGVPPVASGVVRARIGNLSSANALRITLMGLLSKNARKRVTYGRGIERMSEMALKAIDAAGILAIEPRDRSVRLAWSDPLPTDLEGEIRAARGKIELGVEQDRVLGELGYAPSDAGVV